MLARTARFAFPKEAVSVTIFRQGKSVDVLHGEIWLTLLCNTSVVEAGDVRVFQSSENLAFAPEACLDGLRIHPPFDHFHSDQAIELTIRSFPQVDDPHTAPSNFPDQPEGSGQFRLVALPVEKGERLQWVQFGKEFTRPFMRVE